MKDDARAIVVLGMHRGGTSVLARSLEAFGVPVGDKLIEPNEWNPTGYFEHPDIVGLNDALLGLTGRRWHSLDVPSWEEWASVAEPYQGRALEILRAHFGGQPLWGLKDPRITRLLPFWQRVFERAKIGERYVIALRNPLSVARSLAARNGFPPEKSYLLWMLHMFAAIRDTEGRPRVVVDYDELIAHPEAQLARIAPLLASTPARAFDDAIADYANTYLSRSLRHSVHDATDIADDPRAGRMVAKLHELLGRLARDGIRAPEDRRSFDADWSTVGEFLRASASLLRYLDACEDRLEVLTCGPSATERGRAGADTEQGRPEARLPTPATAPAEATPGTRRTPAVRIAHDRSGRPPAERISVVIPLHNHEQYIETAIESVLAQSVPATEIIVIDDGSSDGSAERVRRMCRDHPEIIFWSWPNQGAHHTLNAAIHRATGEFVSILNSDDSYHPERLAHCLDATRANPAADAVASEISFVDEAGRPTTSRWYEEALAFYRETRDWPVALCRANFLMTTSNLFIRRSAFDSVGYFLPLRYAHDLEFFLRLALERKHVHLLPRSLLTYRFHAGNTIAESRPATDVECAAVAAIFLDRLWLREGAGEHWPARLRQFMEALTTRGIADLAGYFLASLRGEAPDRTQAVPQSATAEFDRLVERLGVRRPGPTPRGSLLAEFVEARNTFLRRADAVAEGITLHAAEVARLHAVLGDKDRALQEQAAEIHRMAAVVLGKDRGLSEQAAELQRLHAVLAAKEVALAAQAAEIHRIDAALVAKDAALATQASEIHRLDAVVVAKEAALAEQAAEIHRIDAVLLAKDAALAAQAAEIHRIQDALAAAEAGSAATIQRQAAELEELRRAIAELDQRSVALKAALAGVERELAQWRQTIWYRLAQAWGREGSSVGRLAAIAYELIRRVTPEALKRPARPLLARLKQGVQRRGEASSEASGRTVVLPPRSAATPRPRVLHVIANFMLGGSSRLVVDLIEGLGDAYEHKVVTSLLPSPPAYRGVDVTEFRSPQSPDDVLPFLRDCAPSVVHVHYWGDCDFWWYDIFFRAARTLGCPIVENVNTPVEPYRAEFVTRYVYVSRYVQSTFGDGGARESIIHPGIDFGLFSRRGETALPPDCIGMVYRLEGDKLNERSIDPLIRVVQRRPRTTAIIVGGGTFLEPYRRAAEAAGVAASFTFTGFVDYAELPAVIERMTVFVAPVWKESFGQVGPFAMNMGIPVAGYDVGGVAEIVDDPSLLAAPGDSEALAGLVIGLLDDPARCRAIGARNRDRAQALFSRESMVRAYRDVYQEVLQAPR